MSTKLLGIGLLSVGCMAAAAGGGFLALRPAVPERMPELTLPEPVEVASVAPEAAIEPAVVQSTPNDNAVPQSTAVKPEPAEKTRAAAVTQATKTATKAKPERSTSPVQQRDAETASATTPSPTVAPPAPPPVEPPAATPPAPVAAEPPRYVPDAPVPATEAVQESSRVEIEELTVEKHSVIGIRLDAAVSTKTARVEDRVSATVSRDVTVGSRTAIPAGVRLEGTVTLVEHGGRFKNRPRLGLQFDRMILANGTRVPITTDTIYREGDSPTADSTAKVGAGAMAGAILGAVFGGKKGAAIGGVAGAAGGAAVVMKEDAGETSLPAGAPLTVRLTEDLIVTINR